MTLQAVDPVRLTIPTQEFWIKPETPELCEMPGCRQEGTQWHHIVPRSATSGGVDWITIDGQVLWNKLRVCVFCHDKINNHTVWIRWADGHWVVYWRVLLDDVPVLYHPKSGAAFSLVGRIGGDDD